MKHLQKLREKRNKLIKEMRALLDAAKKEERGLSEDEDTKYQEFDKQQKDLESQIAVEERQVALEAEMNAVPASEKRDTNPGNAGSPNPGAGLGNGSQDGNQPEKRYVQRSGERYLLEKRTRVEISSVNPHQTLGHFLSEIRKAADPNSVNSREAEHLRNSDKELRAALGVSTDETDTAGFLLQPTLSEDLLGKLFEQSDIIKRIKHPQVGENSNSFTWNSPDQSDRTENNLFGGIQVAWTAQAEAMARSRPKLIKNRIELEKLTALYYTTDEAKQDLVALQSGVEMWFPEAFQYMHDKAVYRGSGAGEPLGLLNSDALIIVVKRSGQTAKTFTYENSVDMFARMLPTSLPKSVWLFNMDVFPQLATMSLVIGTGGTAVYQPANGAADAPFATLHGRPIIFFEHCSTLGTLGDVMLVDLDKYAMAEKGGLQTASSIHVQFLTGEEVFRWVWRLNGQPILHKAITPAQGSNTLSAYIALAKR